MGYAVDWPSAEYHEVLPNLFLGGHVWQEGGRVKNGRHSNLHEDKSWDYVVSAYLDRGRDNALPRCDMRLVIFDDTEKGLSEDVWQQIKSVVDEVVARWRTGQKILVRCQAGYNRSGLMMSMVLMRLGFTAEKAISQLRRRRGADVLANPVFERYVYDLEGECLNPDAFPGTEALMNELVPVVE